MAWMACGNNGAFFGEMLAISYDYEEESYSLTLPLERGVWYQKYIPASNNNATNLYTGRWGRMGRGGGGDWKKFFGYQIKALKLLE